MDEKLIEDILRHLDSETQMGVMRMSVEMDEKKLRGCPSFTQMLQYVRKAGE